MAAVYFAELELIVLSAGRSLWIWPPTSRFRSFVFQVVDDKRFDVFVLLVTIFNCGVMAVGTPGDGDRKVSVSQRGYFALVIATAPTY